MATDLQPAQTTPSAKRYEAFVETQLARARARIRSLDVAAAGFGLLSLTLAYGLVLALCDRWLELSPLVRQVAFAIYAGGALVYLGLLIVWPLCQRINPYYAARRLEQTIPEAKNSVVNWLDLHQQALAPAFRNAVGQQAANDLADADLEQAISARRASWLGAGAAIIFICLLVLFVLGPRQFFSLMNRAFAPFIEAPIATRTRLELERPEGGDVTMPVGRAVDFTVWVEGRIPEASSPEALKLLYRYNPGDPYQMRPLERGEDSSRRWLTRLLPSELHNGFWYRVAGGDAETPEYRVQVRSSPLFTGFDVTYHYRPYLGWPDRVTHDQNLHDLRGTEVLLTARTNRMVKNGQLVIDRQMMKNGQLVIDRQEIAAAMVPEDGQSLLFRLRLENDGNYRMWFSSVEGERNIDPMAYAIRVLEDQPPQVELTEPGEDSLAPANGVLQLKGSASDDFGLTKLALRMKLENGAALQPKPYRKGEALRRGDGSYPQMLAYRDFVTLDKLQKEHGEPLEPLAPGAKIEYWLEATDNCDYPGPNIGQSKHFKVTIQPPDAEQKKQEKQREEAGKEQRQHEQKQDKDLQNQKKESRDPSQEQNPRSQDAGQPSKDSDEQKNEDDLNKRKEEIENAIKKNEQQQKEGGKGQSKDAQSQPSKSEGKGEASSSGQNDQRQNPGAAGEGKPQAGRDRPKDNSESKPEQGAQKGEGQAAPNSDPEQRNKRGQEGGEGQKDQGMTEGKKEESKPASNQKDSQNQGHKNTESRPNSNGNGQAQDKATRPSEGSENKDKSSSPKGSAGEKPEANKQQKPGERQQRDSGQKAEKKGPGEKTAKPKAEQGESGKQSDAQREQNPGQRQNSDSGKKGSQQKSGPDKNQAGSGTPSKAGPEKTEKKGSGQSEAMQEAGGSKDKPSQEASEAQKETQSNENQQSGLKQEDGKGGRQTEKGLEKGAGEPETNKTKGSQEKPSNDKDAAGNRDAAKPVNLENKRRQDTQRAQEADKSGEKGSPDSGSRGAQQPQRDRPPGGEAGDKSKGEVSKLSEALKGQDEKTRAAARKKLEAIKEKSTDPAERRAADEALKQADREASGKPGQKPVGKAEEQHKGGDEKKAAPKDPERDTGQADTRKRDGQRGQAPDTKRESGPEKGERGNQPTSPQGPRGSGATGPKGGNEPGPQNASADNPPDRTPDSPEEEPPMAPNAAYEKAAGELQLEDIKKRINKDVLRQLNMTDDDFQNFLKAYQEMQNRKHPATADREKLAVPQRGNRTLPNANVRRVEPGEPGKAGTVQRLGPTLAPPEFREAYKEFSKRISEQTKQKQ